MVTLVLGMGAGCDKGQMKNGALKQQISTPGLSEPYRIKPGDELAVKFYYNPELNENVIVRSDGNISLQLIDEVAAAGLKPLELDQILTDKYSKELRQPTLTVILVGSYGSRIFIGGEVLQPGVIPLVGNMTPLQAIFTQGGFKATANPSASIVIRKDKDNKPIPIPVDLQANLSGNSNTQDFYLRPDDIVYVPQSSIAKANQFVDQYLRQLLMLSGIDFGFSFSRDIK